MQTLPPFDAASAVAAKPIFTPAKPAISAATSFDGALQAAKQHDAPAASPRPDQNVRRLPDKSTTGEKAKPSSSDTLATQKQMKKAADQEKPVAGKVPENTSSNSLMAALVTEVRRIPAAPPETSGDNGTLALTGSDSRLAQQALTALDVANTREQNPDSVTQNGPAVSLANAAPIPLSPVDAAKTAPTGDPFTADKAAESGAHPGKQATLFDGSSAASIASLIATADAAPLQQVETLIPSHQIALSKPDKAFPLSVRPQNSGSSHGSSSQGATDHLAAATANGKVGPANFDPKAGSASAIISQPPGSGGSAANQSATAISQAVATGLTANSGDAAGAHAAPTLPTAAHSQSATLPGDTPLNNPIQLARLMERDGQAEIHIDLRTAQFGKVELHTAVRDSQVGVSVVSERGDLQHFLSNEVSGLQNTLRQHELRLDGIRFFDPGRGASFSGGSDAESRSSHQQPQSGRGGTSSAVDFGAKQGKESEATPNYGSAGRGISVHA